MKKDVYIILEISGLEIKNLVLSNPNVTITVQQDGDDEESLEVEIDSEGVTLRRDKRLKFNGTWTDPYTGDRSEVSVDFDPRTETGTLELWQNESCAAA